jgi:hypothetical protein
VYLLAFHAYINKIHGSRSKISSTKSRLYIYIYIYIYDVKFLALIGAPYIYDVSRLRVNVRDNYSLVKNNTHLHCPAVSAQVSLVSLCLKGNVEMVPKTPSCYCMFLM